MKILCLPLLIFCSLSAFCQQPPLNYKIYSTKSRQLVTADSIINNMANADILFFGEEHNDSTCHVIEYNILKELQAKYPGKTALSMEMFETDCQTVLNEYLAGLIREKNFVTEARAWPNYDDYQPMIEFAKSNNLQVIAANARARYTNMVNRLGLKSLEQLDKTGKTYLPPLPIDT